LPERCALGYPGGMSRIVLRRADLSDVPDVRREAILGITAAAMPQSAREAWANQRSLQ
jgi:hypothetical protein